MKNLLFIIIILMTGMFFSCQEDLIKTAEPDPDVQLKTAEDIDPSVVQTFYRLGISDSGIAGIQRRLLEIGIPREQVNLVLRVIPPITREILAEGKDFDLNVRIKNYLQNDLGLTDDQIRVVVAIATRISNIQTSRG